MEADNIKEAPSLRLRRLAEWAGFQRLGDGTFPTASVCSELSNLAYGASREAWPPGILTADAWFREAMSSYRDAYKRPSPNAAPERSADA